MGCLEVLQVYLEVHHIRRWSLGKGIQGSPFRPTMNYQELFWLLGPYWEDLSPLV